MIQKNESHFEKNYRVGGMICFAVIFEDGFRFFDITKGLLLPIGLEEAQSEIIVSLGGLLVISTADLEDIDQGALREGDGILDLVVLQVIG